jgi:tetratricopeptide (TPR) repeat protein
VSECPLRVKLLQLLSDGEHVPHLRTCAECRHFAERALETLETFRDRSALEAAIRDHIDALIADVPPHRFGVTIFAERTLHRSVVVRDLLRRADEIGGSRPRDALEFSDTAVAICEAMVKGGQPPAPELRFEALKAHSSLLRELGAHNLALDILGRAWTVADETEEREVYRAILALCTAIIYAEPDVANFDEAINLADAAAAVLDVSGDQRRALIARHTKAYALTVQNRFEAAVPLLSGVVAEIAEAGGSSRDAAFAHSLLAMCLVELGFHGEALDHARVAEHLHTECGDTVDAARAAHFVARAIAGMGRFADVREEFTRSADIVFQAGLFDVWCLLRLDYIAAALADDEAADVRADAEGVARVAMTIAAKDSTQRRRFIAEACEYLRRGALRDTLTFDAAEYVRVLVTRSLKRKPARFIPPSGGAFLM